MKLNCKKTILYLKILIFILFSTNAFGMNLIRDSEIEETLYEIADPLLKVANLKNFKIYILNDDEPNAFTAGGNIIYINSGMITAFNDIDVIRGVIAHEIGHILGGHVSKHIENIDLYSKTAILSSALIGISTALMSKNPESSIYAMQLGSHIAERSILAYSRTYESSADQAALRLLESSHHTNYGMVKFFEQMVKQKRGINLANIYDRTHPSDQERISILRNRYNQSQFKNAQNSEELKLKFAKSYAKLFAFSKSLNQVENFIKNSHNKEIENYAKAIFAMRKKDFQNANSALKFLINSKPNDPFYNELYGQILFEFGKKEAIDLYKKALSLRPHDNLFKLGYGIIGISCNKNNTNELKKSYLLLKDVLTEEPNNIIAIRYIAQYYELTNQKGKSLLMSALIMQNIENYKQAKKFAKAAFALLSQNSPEWYLAKDIIDYEK